MAELIRALASCQQRANRLGFTFLSDLLAAGLFEAALQADGGRQAISAPDRRLESVLRAKLRIALARGDSTVVPLATRW